MAAGGTLEIGLAPDTTLAYMTNVSSGVQAFNQDFMVDSVVLYGTGDQTGNDPNTTYLSAQKLSSAGLTNLQISANTTLQVMANADISLAPGVWRDINNNLHTESVALAARDIDLAGKIVAPSGTVSLKVTDDATADPGNPLYQQLVSSDINLEGGSEIDVSGQRVDNSAAANGGVGGAAPLTFIKGGTVTIQDLELLRLGAGSQPGRGEPYRRKRRIRHR